MKDEHIRNACHGSDGGGVFRLSAVSALEGGYAMSSVVQYIIYLAVLVVLAVPLGGYMGKVMNGEKVF